MDEAVVHSSSMSDDADKTTDASVAHIGKLTAHQMRERSCRQDSFAGSLGAPFQYQGNIADRKSENLNENTACDAVTVGKPQTADGVESKNARVFTLAFVVRLIPGCRRSLFRCQAGRGAIYRCRTLGNLSRRSRAPSKGSSPLVSPLSPPRQVSW
jgi:hypothetical protein